MTYCEAKNEVRHKGRATADQALQILIDECRCGRNTRVYKCEFCGDFHVGNVVTTKRHVRHFWSGA